MTPAMHKALESAIRTGNATAHLRGQSEWGGWSRTRMALISRGWIDKNSNITEAGRAIMKNYAERETPRG